jgi:ABC-2 type transport system permease protein
MRIVAHFNPLYYAVQAARTLSNGTIASATVVEGYVVIVGLVVATLWWATRTYQRAVA